MPFIEEYGLLLALIALALLLAGVLLCSLALVRITKHLLGNRVTFTDVKEILTEGGEAYYTLCIANHSLSDVALTSLGYSQGKQYFDFHREYCQSRRMDGKSQIVIPSRQYIKLCLPVKMLEEILYGGMALGKYPQLYAYVLDAVGEKYMAKVKTIHFHVKKQLAARLRSETLAYRQKEREKSKEEKARQKAQKQMQRMTECPATPRQESPSYQLPSAQPAGAEKPLSVERPVEKAHAPTATQAEQSATATAGEKAPPAEQVSFFPEKP